MGEMEEFLSQIIFFRLHFPCMIYFRPGHEIFLWLLDLHNFFPLFFPCANFFSYFARSPPLHKFPNGPSLTNDLVFWGKFFIPWLILLFFSFLGCICFLPLYLSATQVSRIRLSCLGTGDWLADDPVVTILNSSCYDIQTDEHHWINQRGNYLLLL